MVPGTGVLLNNEMDDFAAKPGEPNLFGLRQGKRNAIVPGRRMLSSMSPTLVTRNEQVVLVVGSPGGPRILTAVALVIARVAGDRIPLDQAVLGPTIEHRREHPIPDSRKDICFVLKSHPRRCGKRFRRRGPDHYRSTGREIGCEEGLGVLTTSQLA